MSDVLCAACTAVAESVGHPGAGSWSGGDEEGRRAALVEIRVQLRSQVYRCGCEVPSPSKSASSPSRTVRHCRAPICDANRRSSSFPRVRATCKAARPRGVKRTTTPRPSAGSGSRSTRPTRSRSSRVLVTAWRLTPACAASSLGLAPSSPTGAEHCVVARLNLGEASFGQCRLDFGVHGGGSVA